MTLEQTGAIMDVLSAAYPSHYRKLTEDERYNASCLWAEMFSDDPINVVVAAVKSFIATDRKGFPPSIGIIKDHISKITYGYQKTELEAWDDVRNALRNSAYNALEEFEKLDPIIQRIVGGPSQLREWAMAETGTPLNVIASNFQRSYRAIASNQREHRALPEPVAAIINQLSEAKDLQAEPKKQPKKQEESQPKALPISVEATVNKLKRDIAKAPNFPTQNLPKPLTQEEFEKKKAEILKALLGDDHDVVQRM